MGKTQLLAEMASKAQAMDIFVLLGSGDAIDRTTPYLAWQPLFQMLLGMNGAEPTAVASNHQLPSPIFNEPHLAQRAPLLNALLLTNLPETDLTAQMSGEARASSTQALLVELLQRSITQPTLLILEDAHWLDSASWALAFQVWRQISPLLLVISTRPFDQPTLDKKSPIALPVPEEYQRIRTAVSTRRLELFNLSLQETSNLVCQQFDIDKLPEPLTEFIYQRAEGHPFFTQEMAHSLREAGFIHIHNKKCQMAADIKNLQEMDFPDTIQSLITSRVDRLDPAQQIALKVASVIGRIFSFELLYDIHPIVEDKPFLNNYLTVLSQQDLISQENVEPGLTYSFKHILTQEITYNLLLYSQRRQLHQAIAEWIENTHQDNLSPYYSQLIHHWLEVIKISRAKPEIVLRAIEYLALMGKQALRDGAYQEAINSLKQAIQIGRKWQDARGVRQSNIWEQMAQWHRLLGEAYFNLGQSSDSRQFFEQAVLLLGETIPREAIDLRPKLNRLLFWHNFYRLRTLRPTKLIQARSNLHYFQLFEKARAFRQLGHLYLLTNDLQLALFATLRSFELAAQISISTELARAYANLYQLASLYGRWFLLRGYNFQARETAKRVKYRAQIYRISGHGEELIQKTAETSDDLATQAWVYYTLGQANLEITPWADVLVDFRRAIKIFRGLGDPRGTGDSLNGLGQVHHFQGDFAASQEMFTELSQLGQTVGNAEHQVLGQLGEGSNLLLLGQTADAVTLLEETMPLLANIPEAQIYQVATKGLLAVAWLRLGQTQTASTIVKPILRWLDEPLPVSMVVGYGFDGLGMVYLAKWQEATAVNNQQDSQECREIVSKTIKAWHQFSKRHRIGLPKAWRLQGSYYWLLRRRWLARLAWYRSLFYARKLAMPYETAVSLLEIGRHMSLHNPLRRFYLRRAAAILGKLEAAYDLEQVKMFTISE